MPSRTSRENGRANMSSFEVKRSSDEECSGPQKEVPTTLLDVNDECGQVASMTGKLPSSKGGSDQVVPVQRTKPAVEDCNCHLREAT